MEILTISVLAKRPQSGTVAVPAAQLPMVVVMPAAMVPIWLLAG